MLNITRFITEDIPFKKLEQSEIGKIWSIDPLLAVTHATDFFSIIYFTAIINHAFSRIDDYVNVLIERHIAPYCRWILRVEGLLAQHIYKPLRFVMILTTMKHILFCFFITVKCCVSARAELMHKHRYPIDV